MKRLIEMLIKAYSHIFQLSSFALEWMNRLNIYSRLLRRHCHRHRCCCCCCCRCSHRRRRRRRRRQQQQQQQGILIWFKFQKQIYILAFSIVHQTVSHAICLRVLTLTKGSKFYLKNTNYFEKHQSPSVPLDREWKKTYTHIHIVWRTGKREKNTRPNNEE